MIDIKSLTLIKKWKNKQIVEHASYQRRGYGVCKIEDDYTTCRTHLAYFIDYSDTTIDEYKKLEDIELRSAYYRRSERFCVEHCRSKVDKFFKVLRMFYKKDGELFIDNLLKNDATYYSPIFRKRVVKLATPEIIRKDSAIK